MKIECQEDGRSEKNPFCFGPYEKGGIFIIIQNKKQQHPAFSDLKEKAENLQIAKKQKITKPIELRNNRRGESVNTHTPKVLKAN